MKADIIIPEVENIFVAAVQSGGMILWKRFVMVSFSWEVGGKNMVDDGEMKFCCEPESTCSFS
jgi:hypothetical protein